MAAFQVEGFGLHMSFPGKICIKFWYFLHPVVYKWLEHMAQTV